jgi:protein ImuB
MICCLVSETASACPPGALEAVARACSPRVAPYGDAAVVFDASGLTGMFGSGEDLARDVHRLAAGQGLLVRVALAGTTTTAWLLAHARSGPTVAAPGRDAEALAALPIRWLSVLREGDSSHALAILDRWGVRTLGEVARLPRADVRARLGLVGVRLHQAACGEETAPLVPAVEPGRFVERLECEWPLEGRDPLSFVLARLCETLSAALERADRGAVDVTLRLRLVTRGVHERTLHLPAPMRDARVLRTLLLLDLESHPPSAAIDVVEVELAVAPGRIAQGSLLSHAVPAPEELATLTARLGALMGDSRIGAPALVDTHDARRVAQKDLGGIFRPTSRGSDPADANRGQTPWMCLRRFRLPISARVTVEQHAPVRVVPAARGLPGGQVVARAGPWRTSGGWWAADRRTWDRDEWDVELADGGVYRLARDRDTGRWELDGVMD